MHVVCVDLVRTVDTSHCNIVILSTQAGNHGKLRGWEQARPFVL